jgi:glycosyltransferase involved in cell wall biosynthesis
MATSRDQRAIIVIPCYNEENRLPVERLLAFLAAGPREVSFLLVDDGSRDGTLSKLENLRRQCPDRVVVLPLKENRGKGEAVRQGVMAALASGPATVGFWDADLAAPLEEIPHLLGVLDRRPEVEMVMGIRVQTLGRQISRRPWRHYLGRVGASLISLLLQMPVYDTQCGAKIFRANRHLAQVFALPFQARWLFDVEIILRYLALFKNGDLAVSPMRGLYEEPLSRWMDVSGSKVNIISYLRALAEFYRLWRSY